MKRIILILTILLLPLSVSAGKTVPRTQLSAFINEFRSCEGVELVQLGSLATAGLKAAARMAARADDDPDTAHALALLKGVRRLTVLDYEDSAPAVKEKMNRRLNRLLNRSELLLEAKDGEDAFSLYGVIDDKAGTVRDLVLHSPGSCALICIFGKVSMDAVAKLVENND